MEAKRLPGEGLKADARAELWVLVDSLKHYHLVIDLHHVWQQSILLPFQRIIVGHSMGIMDGQACTEPPHAVIWAGEELSRSCSENGTITCISEAGSRKSEPQCARTIFMSFSMVGKRLLFTLMRKSLTWRSMPTQHQGPCRPRKAICRQQNSTALARKISRHWYCL